MRHGVKRLSYVQEADADRLSPCLPVSQYVTQYVGVICDPVAFPKGLLAFAYRIAGFDPLGQDPVEELTQNGS